MAGLVYRVRASWCASVPAATRRGELAYRGTLAEDWDGSFTRHFWVCVHDHATREEAQDCARAILHTRHWTARHW